MLKITQEQQKKASTILNVKKGKILMFKTIRIFQLYKKIMKNLLTTNYSKFNLIYSKLKESPEASANPTLNKASSTSLSSNNNYKNNNLIRKGKNQIKKKTQLLNKYINSISKFNSHIANSQIIEYNFNKANSKLISIEDISSIINNSFYSMSAFVSKPVFYNTPAKMVIYLFYYSRIVTKKYIKLIKGRRRRKIFKYTIININKHNKLFKINTGKIEKLSNYLSKKFNKQVNIELVRLYHPENNSDILAKVIGFICNKIKFRKILNRVFRNARIRKPNKIISHNSSLVTKLPTLLCGLKIRLGGRLLTHRVVPRKTVKMDQIGSLSRRNIKFIDTGRFTNKNKRGAYSITVTSGHIHNS